MGHHGHYAVFKGVPLGYDPSTCDFWVDSAGKLTVDSQEGPEAQTVQEMSVFDCSLILLKLREWAYGNWYNPEAAFKQINVVLSEQKL